MTYVLTYRDILMGSDFLMIDCDMSIVGCWLASERACPRAFLNFRVEILLPNHLTQKQVGTGTSRTPGEFCTVIFASSYQNDRLLLSSNGVSDARSSQSVGGFGYGFQRFAKIRYANIPGLWWEIISENLSRLDQSLFRNRVISHFPKSLRFCIFRDLWDFAVIVQKLMIILVRFVKFHVQG